MVTSTTETMKPLKPQPPGFDKAFRSTNRVQGFTHDFYKYPARFSPGFVRFILDLLTEPGDYVLDPFMGGGTTIVEATTSGRYSIGSDINTLAKFVTSAKTTPLSKQDIEEIRDWVQCVKTAIDQTDFNQRLVDGPVKNMPVVAYSFFSTANSLVQRIRFPRRQQFARCALVRVGQWALDSRSSIPCTAALSDQLELRVERMLDGLSEFVSAAKESGVDKNKITSTRQLLGYSASDTQLVRTLTEQKISPRLILTSPPYPGVHMLYHRWQVQGRRETSAPYWLANVRDGHSESYYTMGSRSALGLKNYFNELLATFNNLRHIATPDAKIVQLISFSDTIVQLPRYLDIMNKAGFEETTECHIVSQQMRSVPNRKWYNQHRSRNDASTEILLIHRPKTATSR